MEVSDAEGFRQRPGWFVVVAILLIGQGWLTLRLFTPDFTLGPLINDDPVVSGRHALHLYHGMIGSKAWQERDTSSCYDPAYQAGYPKTPVFDGGSRPSELFQVIGGPRPASYKIGLALCCLFAPLAFVGMGRGVGLSPPGACAAGLLGCVLWWAPPCRALIDAGDFDLLLGGLCALIHVTWLIRFERIPAIDSWIVMTLFGVAAWYMQPFLMVAYFPILLLYFLWIATRQSPIWHLAIVATLFVTFGLNYLWLRDWGRHLWLYLPLGGRLPPPVPIWETIMNQWKDLLPLDPVSIGISAAGLLGLLALLGFNRSAAWLLGLGTLAFTFGAGVGKLWPMLSDFGAERLLVIASWCLVCPAAYLLTSVAAHLGTASGWRPVGFVWIVVALAGLAWSIDLPSEWSKPRGLEIGLNADRAQTCRTLVERTTPEARILWEDRTGRGLGWTALLAVLTERPFLGGLDAAGRLEHMYPRLNAGKLGGKPLEQWTDAQILKFASRYNVGWIVAFEPDSIARFRTLPFAKAIADVKDGVPGVLFALDRKPNFFLKGRGRVVEADWQRIALADVEPEDGEVVLSWHFQSNMRIAPAYAQAERDLDLDDPIPLIRLRVLGPVARLTIIWDNP